MTFTWASISAAFPAELTVRDAVLEREVYALGLHSCGATLRVGRASSDVKVLPSHADFRDNPQN